MELDIKNRLMSLDILAEVQGNYITLKIVRELQEKLSFSTEEIKRIGLKDAPGGMGGVSWDNSKEGDPKDIDFCEIGNQVMVDRLKALDGANRLTQSYFSLYELFVINQEEK